MFIGAHSIIYSKRPEEVRAFLRDVLELDSIDIGQGWLVFALPSGELAVHPDEGATRYGLYLMCEDIAATVQRLEAKGVELTQPVTDQGWGLLTAIRLPEWQVVLQRVASKEFSDPSMATRTFRYDQASLLLRGNRCSPTSYARGSAPPPPLPQSLGTAPGRLGMPR